MGRVWPPNCSHSPRRAAGDLLANLDTEPARGRHTGARDPQNPWSQCPLGESADLYHKRGRQGKAGRRRPPEMSQVLCPDLAPVGGNRVAPGTRPAPAPLAPPERFPLRSTPSEHDGELSARFRFAPCALGWRDGRGRQRIASPAWGCSSTIRCSRSSRRRWPWGWPRMGGLSLGRCRRPARASLTGTMSRGLRRGWRPRTVWCGPVMPAPRADTG